MKRALRNACLLPTLISLMSCCEKREITKSDVMLWVEENVEFGSDLRERLLSDLEKVPTTKDSAAP
jgi:hypothetical protein